MGQCANVASSAKRCATKVVLSSLKTCPSAFATNVARGILTPPFCAVSPRSGGARIHHSVQLKFQWTATHQLDGCLFPPADWTDPVFCPIVEPETSTSLRGAGHALPSRGPTGT